MADWIWVRSLDSLSGFEKPVGVNGDGVRVRVRVCEGGGGLGMGFRRLRRFRRVIRVHDSFCLGIRVSGGEGWIIENGRGENLCLDSWKREEK